MTVSHEPIDQAKATKRAHQQLDWRVAQEFIGLLAELFPRCFTRQNYDPHKPLKIRIATELVSLGIVTPDEVALALSIYTRRLMYQRALASGAPRIGLDGDPAGEVTAEEIAHAKATVAAIEAKQKRRSASAKAVADKRKAARPADRGPPTKPGLSLSDLRAAARARRGSDERRTGGSA